MQLIENYQKLIADVIAEHQFTQEPQALYEPNNYIMNLGGKRLRPVMVLMAADMFGGDLQKVLKPALAIECFHNFTLMHDDIMDHAPLRRGQTTVHIKYSTNTAILSGDALMISSYQFFEDLEPELFKHVVKLFSKTAAQICDGQQYDIDFETQKEVTYNEYLKMIELKTGVMVAASFKIGAMIAGASEEDANQIYEFGKNLGIAFQIKDDYLDVFGSADLFGKKHAGDIYENKKTILYFIAKSQADKETLKELEFWYSMKTDSVDKVYAIEKIFRRLRVNETALEVMNAYNRKAAKCLENIQVSNEQKQPLRDISKFLIERQV